ncbi:hypothetical protein K469DRAFT_549141, partial [Zopfia rhizophila CBS 207.26]
LLATLKEIKDHLAKINYNNLDALKDYLKIKVNLTYLKLLEYYIKFNNSSIYYTIIILYLLYKHALKAL